jgi:hypothetical protein
MHRYFSTIKFRYGSNFDIPKEQRTAAAGQFSDLIVTSFLNAKDGKLVAKRKKKKDRTARKETGIRSAREALFYSTKAFGFNDLASKEQLELETPRNCYVCKQNLLKCIIFMTVCADCGDFNYAKRFQTADVRVAVITGSRLK